MKRNDKFGFTLVELLAVIVILAIILVIAVPKIMDVINDSKKATLESTVKMIATQAEKAKVQNTLLGNTETITCEDITNINDVDYADCDIAFDNNTAKVTIIGSGKFEGLYVCNGTKTSAEANEEECETSGGSVETGASFLEGLLANEETEHNGLVQTSATYTNEDSEEITVDAGIRYVGPLTGDNAVKNQVYFNCEPTDGTNAYGSENYNYASSCEVWRIIGVFEVEDGSGNIEKRVKIINTASRFEASWDSSASDINYGYGINQWGSSTLTDGTSYAGADLMQLLNGYYIEKNDSTIATADKKECKYNNTYGQSGFGQTCDTTDAPLSSVNMKPLTSTALSMIDEAVWYTYGVNRPSDDVTDGTWAPNAYLQERGITKKYTGCTNIEATTTTQCTTEDNVTRDNEWAGLVGLMSVSDITYANGWLYNGSIYPWSITPHSSSSYSSAVWCSHSSYATSYIANYSYGVWPAAYLSSNVQIIGGDGKTEPYKLK